MDTPSRRPRSALGPRRPERQSLRDAGVHKGPAPCAAPCLWPDSGWDAWTLAKTPGTAGGSDRQGGPHAPSVPAEHRTLVTGVCGADACGRVLATSLPGVGRRVGGSWQPRAPVADVPGEPRSRAQATPGAGEGLPRPLPAGLPKAPGPSLGPSPVTRGTDRRACTSLSPRVGGSRHCVEELCAPRVQCTSTCVCAHVCTCTCACLCGALYPRLGVHARVHILFKGPCTSVCTRMSVRECMCTSVDAHHPPRGLAGPRSWSGGPSALHSPGRLSVCAARREPGCPAGPGVRAVRAGRVSLANLRRGPAGRNHSLCR